MPPLWQIVLICLASNLGSWIMRDILRWRRWKKSGPSNHEVAKATMVITHWLNHMQTKLGPDQQISNFTIYPTGEAGYHAHSTRAHE